MLAASPSTPAAASASHAAHRFESLATFVAYGPNKQHLLTAALYRAQDVYLLQLYSAAGTPTRTFTAATPRSALRQLDALAPPQTNARRVYSAAGRPWVLRAGAQFADAAALL